MSLPAGPVGAALPSDRTVSPVFAAQGIKACQTFECSASAESNTHMRLVIKATVVEGGTDLHVCLGGAQLLPPWLRRII